MEIVQKFMLYVCTILVLTGCSSSVIPPSANLQNNSDIALEYEPIVNLKADTLWELRIVQGGEEKFIGLLVLKSSGNFLSLALLDPSGVKLFEENIADDGTVFRVQYLSFFEKHRLPEYLGKVINRVFKLVPDLESCSGNLYNFCWAEDSALLGKIAKWGPFVLWSVVYSSTSDNGGATCISIIHHSPWLGTTVYLKNL